MTEELLDQLEKLQNQRIRFVFGLQKFKNFCHFKNALNLLTIRLRKNAHVLYKILFLPSAPDYLRQRFAYRYAMGHHLRVGTNLSHVLPPRSCKF